MPRTHRFFLLPLAAALLVLASFLPAQAQAVDPQPAAAVKGFFTSVAAQDYATAWSLLSATSQARIIEMVASDEKMDPAKVKELFDTNSEALRNGFWESFRTSSKAEAFAASTFQTVDVAGNSASVTMDGLDPAQLTFKAFQENGAWKFGLIETFPM